MRSGARFRSLAVVAALTLALAGCGDQGLPAASPSGSMPPSLSVELPSPTDSGDPSASVAPSGAPSDAPFAGADAPSPTPFKGRAVATRIVIPDLGIDLAVVKSPAAGVYPYCNVAMYMASLGQPGESRATYIFAHARDGMFGPIYNLTMVKRTPNVMVGMLVEVYTSDSEMHTYVIAKVRPHQLTLNAAMNARTDQLWLQTSEGPHGTPGKTQVVANPVEVSSAGYLESHPKPRIVHCG